MRLFSILNGICQYIAARNKTLWSGSWSEGSITVPDTAKYRTFLIKFGTRYMFAINNGGNRIVGTYFFISNNGQNIYQNQFEADISGNTWSIHSQTQVGHLGGAGHPQITQVNPANVVEEIVGLEPILSAFVTIGGGYYLVPKGWWQYETIHHPINPSKPHIHRRKLDTDRTVFDSIWRCLHRYTSNNSAKQIRYDYSNIHKNVFTATHGNTWLRHFRRIRVIVRRFIQNDINSEFVDFAQQSRELRLYKLDSDRPGLTLKGVAA